MKIKSTFIAFTAKALLITCITLGFSGFNVCNAQSPIVGKWKEVSVKQFFNDENAKKMGRPFVEHQMRDKDIYEWEFKADHTYVIIHGAGKDDKTIGEWSVTGNQLTMKGAAQLRRGSGSEIYTFSITGSTMIRTMMVQPPYNTMVVKQEDTSIRM